MPRRPPSGPACPRAAGGGPSAARASAPPQSLRGACGRLSGPRTGARSFTPSAAAQIRTRWGWRPADSPGTRTDAAPSEPFVRPSLWRFGEWLGRDAGRGLGAEGRGGPPATSET